MNLVQKKCVPCESSSPPLSNKREEELAKEIPSWIIRRAEFSIATGRIHKIHREFKFKNFKEAMSFVNKVSEIAEEEGHHPDIYIFYNKVQLDLHTHAVGGLSENDFIMAAKIDALKTTASI